MRNYSYGNEFCLQVHFHANQTYFNKTFQILKPRFKNLTVFSALQSQRNARFKAVLNDSLITVETTSLDQQTVLLHHRS